MATTTRVQQWTFAASSHYTLADDAAITASVLSLTDPTWTLGFGGQRWSVRPDAGHYDENDDLVLQNGVVYRAQSGGTDLYAADGMFVFNAKRGVMAGTKKLKVYFRYDSVGDDKLVADMVDGTGGRILNSDGAVIVRDAEWFDSWNESGTWREFSVRFTGADVRFRTGAYRGITNYNADRTAAGTAALTQNDANNPITVGNGGAADVPTFYYRRTGTCELKAANAYTIPYGTTALGRLTLVADRVGDGTEPLDLAVEFKIDDGAWTALPADGDLSGESFTAGTSTFLWRLSTMDNANDCRYVPSVYAAVLTYEQTSPTWDEDGELAAILRNIKAALNADATLMGYKGWSRAQVGWADVMDLQMYHRCGCIVEWKDTPEGHQGATKEAGQLVNTIDEKHTVVVKACMRYDRTSLEAMLIDDDQLLPFTEDVLRVLRAETLGDTVHSVTVGQRTPSAEYFESSEGEDEPGDILLTVDIEVEVHGKPFTAVRP